jgi:glycerol-3-phosphate dehydrogenase
MARHVNIDVVGAGPRGPALTQRAVRRGRPTRPWAREAEVADTAATGRTTRDEHDPVGAAP